MVLGKLPVPGRLTNLDNSGARPTALAVGAGGGCLDIFSLVNRGWSGGAMVLGKHPYQIISRTVKYHKYNKPIRGAIFNFNKLVSDLNIETCTPDS